MIAGATGEQDVRVRIRLHQRLVERALGCREADVLMQPLRERLPRRQLRQVGGCARHGLDLVDVHGLEKRLPRGEVTVERADPDPGPLRHLLERSRRALLGEERARGRHELVVVHARVGALVALRMDLGLAHGI